MPKPNRPKIVTLFAYANLLLGLAALAYAALTLVPNFEALGKTPPPPSQPSADSNATPSRPGVMPMPTPPKAYGPNDVRPPAPLSDRPLPDSNVLGIMKDQQKWLRGQVDYYEMYLYVVMFVAVILALLYLGSALGMLGLNPAGQQLAIFVAIMGSLAILGSAYVYWDHVKPQLQKWENNRNDQIEKVFNEPRPGNIYQQFYGAWNSVIPAGVVLYSALLTIVLLTPGVRTAFYWRSRPKAATEPPSPAAA